MGEPIPIGDLLPPVGISTEEVIAQLKILLGAAVVAEYPTRYPDGKRPR
jgi:hypothetical protein